MKLNAARKPDTEGSEVSRAEQAVMATGLRRQQGAGRRSGRLAAGFDNRRQNGTAISRVFNAGRCRLAGSEKS
jgi:hypothetical protein